MAHYRPDPVLAADVDEIEENPEDATEYPSSGPGEVPLSWLKPRMVGSARLTGAFCAVTSAVTIAALRPLFVEQARSLGSQDFDAAALKDGRRRDLTQAVATYLHNGRRDLAGIVFNSRHGDNVALWAIFERPQVPNVSPNLTDRKRELLSPTHPDLDEAFRTHGLRWGPAGS